VQQATFASTEHFQPPQMEAWKVATNLKLALGLVLLDFIARKEQQTRRLVQKIH